MACLANAGGGADGHKDDHAAGAGIFCPISFRLEPASTHTKSPEALGRGPSPAARARTGTRVVGRALPQLLPIPANDLQHTCVTSRQ